MHVNLLYRRKVDLLAAIHCNSGIHKNNNFFLKVLFVPFPLFSSVSVNRKSLILVSLAFFILLFTTITTYASTTTFETHLKFKHLTPSNGLSQSYVFDMVQDNDGYIWIATQDGLNKYDGAKFKYYRSNILDPNSLADNYIRKLFKDSKGQIWIGTQNGLK